MSPFLARKYRVDGHSVDAESLCERHGRFAVRVRRPNLADIVLREPGGMMLDAALGPSLLHHVSGVVVTRSQEKVIRPHAGRVVAVMENVEVIRDRASMQFPGGTTRPNIPLAPPPSTELSVAVVIDGAGPGPAWAEIGPMRWRRSVLADLRPEALRKWARASFVARRRAVAARAGRPVLRGDRPVADHAFGLRRGSIRLHRDLPLNRNRGAAPRAGNDSIGAFSRPYFTTSPTKD